MKVLALSRKPRPYILKDHRKESNPPIFTIISMTQTEKYELQVEQLSATQDLDVQKLFDVKKKFDARIEAEKAKAEDGKTAQANGEDIMDEFGDEMIEASRFIVKSKLANRRTWLTILRDKKKLVDWRSVPVEGENGIEMLPFDPENIDCLPDEILNELCDEILGIIGEPEAKNSEGLLSAESGQEARQITEQDGTAKTA
jgi:hypothetical protein